MFIIKTKEYEGNELPRAINFGCGRNLLKNHLNIDMEDFSQEGLTFAQGDLINPQELPNDYFGIIEAQMVLEHIHIDVLPTVIYTMSCTLVYGGKVHVTVPNFEYFAHNLPVKTCPEAKFTLEDLIFLREATFQLLDPVFDTHQASFRGHQSLWTPDMAQYLFNSEGFRVEFLSEKEPILQFYAEKRGQFSVAMGV
jgi:hypothetical protein